MRLFIIGAVLAMTACTSHPPQLTAPASDAPVSNLNPGRWTPVTNDLNDLMREPTVPSSSLGAR